MSTYETNIPGASGYGQSALLAQRAYDNAMARYKNQRGQTLLKYGYKQNEDGSYGVDANNEYGSYQQMLRGEAGQTEDLQRAQAGSGWGTDSGYLGKERDDLSYAQGGEQAALGQGLVGQLSDISLGEQDAAYNKDAALYQGQLDAARQAIDKQQFDPGDYTGLDETPAAPKAPAAKAAPLRRAVATHNAGKAQLMRAKQRRATAGKKVRR